MNEELMVKYQKKELLHSRIQTCMLGLVLLIVIGAVIVTALEVRSLKSALNRVESNITATLDDINLEELDISGFDMESINQAIDSLTEAADTLSAMDIVSLNDTVTSLKSAADTLGGIDIETMNSAIASLQDAADTLKGIDVESLNALVTSLETVASKLENTVNSFTGIFSR